MGFFSLSLQHAPSSSSPHYTPTSLSILQVCQRPCPARSLYVESGCYFSFLLVKPTSTHIHSICPCSCHGETALNLLLTKYQAGNHPPVTYFLLTLCISFIVLKRLVIYWLQEIVNASYTK